MPRIAGVDIAPKKRLQIGLTYLFGVGRSRAREILQKLNLPPDPVAGDLNEEQVSRLNTLIENEYVVEGSLRRQIQENIHRLIHIACYRGARHKAGLPVRGQRTRSNARTRKGPRRTVAGKKRAPAPK
jgi:small subunit ribosomal protein S13